MEDKEIHYGARGLAGISSHHGWEAEKVPANANRRQLASVSRSSVARKGMFGSRPTEFSYTAKNG
jgi:hypothetical protein